MNFFCKSAVVLLPLVPAGLALPADTPPAPTTAEDEKVLAGVGLKTDAPALLAFFRKRSLTEADQREIARLIRQLGHDRFEMRAEASSALTAWGTPALELLRKALNDPDAEIVRRAEECIEDIERGPGPLLPIAAARLLAHRRPAEATGILLTYLPFADDDSVVEEVCTCLLALNPLPGQPDPKLLEALTAAQPVVRGAAAHVVGRRGSAEQRDAVARLLTDPQARVRFRAACALLSGRDRRALSALVGLLGDGPLDLAWQAEDILIALAETRAPPVSVSSGGDEGRRKALAAWQAWLKDHGALANLALYEETQRLLGLTLGIEYNTGRVWECRMDGMFRWDVRGLAGPMEAQVLPGGRILIAESTGRSVSERDTKGTILWQKKLDKEPTGAQRLANGNTFISTYTSVMEFDQAGNQVYQFAINPSNAIRKHRNGNIIYATDTEIVEADVKGQKLRGIPLPREGMWVGLRDLPNDRFLVANSTSGRVLEVDRTGQILWQSSVKGACGIARLPSGNTLVATSGRVVELSRDGREVWEKKTEGYVRRVHRR